MTTTEPTVEKPIIIKVTLDKLGSAIRLSKRQVFPVAFGLTADQKHKLKTVPRNSFKAIQEGKGTKSDWHNVTFWVMCGAETAKLLYTEKSYQELQVIENMCLEMYLRYLKEHKVYFKDDEAAYIEAAFEATDTMYDDNLRRHLLPAAQTALTRIQKIQGG